MDEEGWVPYVQVYSEEGRKSLVLDSSGEPFTLKRTNPIGFQLKPRKQKNAD